MLASMLSGERTIFATASADYGRPRVSRKTQNDLICAAMLRPSDKQSRQQNGGYLTRRERLLVTVCNLTPGAGWPALADRNQPPPRIPWRVLGLPWLRRSPAGPPPSPAPSPTGRPDTTRSQARAAAPGRAPLLRLSRQPMAGRRMRPQSPLTARLPPLNESASSRRLQRAGPQPRRPDRQGQEVQRRLPRGSPAGPAGTRTALTTEDAPHSADSAWLAAVSAMGSASRRSNRSALSSQLDRGSRAGDRTADILHRYAGLGCSP